METTDYNVLKLEADAPVIMSDLGKIVHHTPSNPNLNKISLIRQELSVLAPVPIPDEYLNWQVGPLARKASEISVSPRFGKILYMLVYSLQPNLVVEAGAGYGISGSYICSALAARKTGTLLSFESGQYAGIANQILQRFWHSSLVINDRIEELPRYIGSLTSIDLIFLDAMHHGDIVARQTRLLMGFCSRDCMIVVDDAFQANRGSLLPELERLAADRRTSSAVTIGTRFFICTLR